MTGLQTAIPSMGEYPGAAWTLAPLYFSPAYQTSMCLNASA
jgi:hypothetical protein